MSVRRITLPPDGSAARSSVPGALRGVRRGIVASVRTMRCLGSRHHSATVREMWPARGDAPDALSRLSAAHDRRREVAIHLRRFLGSGGPLSEVRGVACSGPAAGRGHGEYGGPRGGMHHLGTALAKAASGSWVRSGRGSRHRARSTSPAPRSGAPAADSRNALAGDPVGTRPQESAPGGLRGNWYRASLGPARGRCTDHRSDGFLMRHRPEKCWCGPRRAGDRGAIPPRSGPRTMLRYNRRGLSSGSVVARGIIPR